MPLLRHIASAWPREGFVASGDLPESCLRDPTISWLPEPSGMEGCVMGRGSQAQAGPRSWVLGAASPAPFPLFAAKKPDRSVTVTTQWLPGKALISNPEISRGQALVWWETVTMETSFK